MTTKVYHIPKHLNLGLQIPTLDLQDAGGFDAFQALEALKRSRGAKGQDAWMSAVRKPKPLATKGDVTRPCVPAALCRSHHSTCRSWTCTSSLAVRLATVYESVAMNHGITLWADSVPLRTTNLPFGCTTGSCSRWCANETHSYPCCRHQCYPSHDQDSISCFEIHLTS